MKLQKSAKCIACKNCIGYLWGDNEEGPSYIDCKLENKKDNSVIKGHLCESFIHHNSLFEGVHVKKNE